MGEGKDPKGNVLLIIGAFLVILALTADVFGVGSSPGFGWKQGLLLVIGIGIALMGMKCCQCPSKGSSDSSDEKDQPPSSDQV